MTNGKSDSQKKKTHSKVSAEGVDIGATITVTVILFGRIKLPTAPPQTMWKQGH